MSEIQGIGEDYRLWSTRIIENVLLAWQALLDRIEPYDFSTIRLGAHFANSTGSRNGSSELLWSDLDAIIELLDQNGYDVILNLCMNYSDHAGWFGSPGWLANWIETSKRYMNDDRIAAYELFNEPKSSTWHNSVTNELEILRALQNCITELRALGDDTLILMPDNVSHHKPGVTDSLITEPLLRENVVYGQHTWAYWWREESKISIDFDFNRVKDAMSLFENTYDLPVLMSEFGLSPELPIELTKAYNIALINLCMQEEYGFLFFHFSRNHGLQGVSEQVFSESDYSPYTPPPEPEPEPPECHTNADCKENEICVDGKCVPKGEPTYMRRAIGNTTVINCLGALRNFMFTEQQHRKLHPLI